MNLLAAKEKAWPSRDLAQYDAANSAVDSVLDDLARLAAQICEAPLAMISVTGTNAIWLRGAAGVDCARLPLECLPSRGFEDGLCEIQDIRQDPDFSPDGVLIEGRHYCFYAALSLGACSGGNGLLSVLDRHPRQLTEPQTEALKILCRQAMSRLEMLDRMRSMGRSPEEGFAPARQDVDGKHRSVLEKMKDEFISTVSHELRTPLTSLRGALGLLSGGALETRPEKSRQMLEIAINNTDRLVKLVNDILDLQRISSGKSDLRRTDILAKELLRRAVEMEAIPQNRISLTADEIFVWADVDLIVQVLRNLLSNAIKFSPAESRIALCARSLNDQEIVFEIHDEGRGIPEDKLEHIFERFQQVDASDSRDLGGTGLGLAICRSIIHLHGGRIWATSTPGSETTFSFTLPISQN
ncbi:hypothetical protein H7846_15085 [Edaphobacter sp. 4G125]|nr:hypothetical protein H7846_15085 [Edaphobacter sp. 4G125]